jgi:hypothetical protein
MRPEALGNGNDAKDGANGLGFAGSRVRRISAAPISANSVIARK